MSESQQKQVQLAASMFTGIASLGRDTVFQKLLSEDQYLFAAYMCAVSPVLNTVLEMNARTNNRTVLNLTKDLIYGQEEKLSSAAVESLDDRHEALKLMNELKNHLGAQLTAAYSSNFIRFTQTYKFAVQKRIHSPEEILGSVSALMMDSIEPEREGVFGQNLRWLRKLTGMSTSETNLLNITTLITIEPSVNIFFRYLEHALAGRSDLLELLSLAVIIDYKRDEGNHNPLLVAMQALDEENSKPLAFGLARYSKATKRFSPMSDFWLGVLLKEYEDIDELCGDLLIEAKDKTSTSGALARIDDAEKALLSKLLTVIKDNPDAAVGCNLLCYGARRFDKRSVVLDFLKDKVDGAFELHRSGTYSSDMPSIAWIAQEHLRKLQEKTGKTYVLMIDNAEDVLTRSRKRSSLMYELFGNDKSASSEQQPIDADEHLLSKSPTMTIWMTSSITSMAEDAVGRFLAHIEVKGGTRADRRAEVQKVATELNLPDELVQHLAKYTELGSYQVRSAAKVTKLLGLTGEDASKLIISSIEASQKALQRTKTEEIRESVTKYDLTLLNLSGKFGIDKIVKALGKKPSGTLCFYGLPGTGKTQLAEHIALAIDKPLLIKRASDIFDKYLGESEKRVREMFEEGISEDAIVLLDEADSFMRDRKLAKQSWEISIVNELLTRMERYPGIFICATNLFEQLDAAALRRFTFKLQFHSLSEAQRTRMFENETGVKVTDMDDPRYLALQGIKYLTPGDFATVKRQANMLDETLSPDDWLEQLLEESKAKMNGIQSMGLSAEDQFIQAQMPR
jgi:hypothetical protein